MKNKFALIGTSAMVLIGAGLLAASPAHAGVNKSAQYSTYSACRAVQSGPAYNNSFVRSSPCQRWVGSGGYSYYQFTYTTRTR